MIHPDYDYPLPADIPEATLLDGLVFSWESQAVQYPPSGTPGITYSIHRDVGFDRDHELKTRVEALTLRNDDGRLIGILYYYPDDAYDEFGFKLESAGNVNLYVSPSARHQGVATRLVDAALTRWPSIDFLDQRYSQAGVNFICSYLRRKFAEILRAEPDSDYYMHRKALLAERIDVIDSHLND